MPRLLYCSGMEETLCEHPGFLAIQYVMGHRFWHLSLAAKITVTSVTYPHMFLFDRVIWLFSGFAQRFRCSSLLKHLSIPIPFFSWEKPWNYGCGCLRFETSCHMEKMVLGRSQNVWILVSVESVGSLFLILKSRLLRVKYVHG